MTSLSGLAFSADTADTTVPSDVDNVVAEASDGKVILSWDLATDDVGVTGYKVYSGLTSVDEQGEKYTYGDQDVGDVVSAEIGNLENGTMYYFAVTAYDAAGNESDQYSYEVDATPEAGLGDGVDDAEAPTVVEAKAVSKVEVEVEFSEKVQLLEEHPEQAFTIENEETLEQLDVLDAVVMEDKDVDKGKEGLVVKLTTAEQVKDSGYILTATIDVTDLADNPIISGTSDTALFTGTDAEPVEADAEGPEVVDVEYIDSTGLLVNFNEAVVLSLNPANHFKVTVKGALAGAAGLDVSEVVLGNNTALGLEDSSAMLKLTAMTAGETYVVEVSGIADEDGNPLVTDKASAEVVVPGGVVDDPVDDVVVGELKEAEDFTAKVTQAEDLVSVLLSWTLPVDTTSTLQKLYKSMDGSTYGDEASLGTSLLEHEVSAGLDAGNSYWFKLTQLDEAGNETEGVVAKVTLAETGPGVVGLVLVSLGLGRWATRKRG